MARPTQTRLNTGGGLALDQSRAPALQVVAPLNVRTGPSQAEILADALGVAFKAAEPAVQARIQKDAAESTALGRNDAALNRVDAKRQAEDASYSVGVKRGIVDRAIVDFKSQAREFYENAFDKAKGTEELAEALDAIARGSLNMYASDPDAARWMTPEVVSEMARITGVHDQELAAQFKQDLIASASSLMTDRLDEQRSVDPEEVMSKLRPILGNSEATKAYVKMVGSLGVERRDPDLIDALIPERWADGTPGPRSIPELNEELNQARYYAENAQRGYEAELKTVGEADAERVMLRGVLDVMQGIDPTGTLAKGIKEGLPITSSDLLRFQGAFRTSRDDIREQRLDPNRLAAFRAVLIDDPKSVTTADLLSFVAGNYSPGKDGVTQTGVLIDDYISAKRAGDKIDSNPLAKADRSYFAGRYKPESYATDAEKERYFQGLRLFDKTFLDTEDPEKSRAAAEEWFTKRPLDAVKASGNIQNDAKAFFDGKIDLSALRAAYPQDGFATSIYERYKRGDISREQAEKIITAISGTQQQ